MATVAQMIEWFKTLPQDAEVECGIEITSGYSTYMEYNPVDIESCDVFDYRDPKNWATSKLAGKVVVRINAR